MGLRDGKKTEDMYNRLDIIPACDRHTDRQTDRRAERQTDILPRHSSRCAYASRGMNEVTVTALVCCCNLVKRHKTVFTAHRNNGHPFIHPRGCSGVATCPTGRECPDGTSATPATHLGHTSRVSAASFEGDNVDAVSFHCRQFRRRCLFQQHAARQYVR